MSQHTFAFRQPRWQAPNQLLTRSVTLLLITLIWCGLYGLLAYRLWQFGAWTGIERHWRLLAACIVLGVSVVVAWSQTMQRWRALTGTSVEWAALAQPDLQKLTPAEFEAYVAQRIFARQGYRVLDTPHVKDGGVDIRLEDAHGTLAIVQCKRYRSTVGEPTVRELYGTMIHAGAAHAFLTTSNGISAEARSWARGKPIDLIDGYQLEALARAPLSARTPAFERFVTTFLDIEEHDK